jgi:transposase
LKDKYNDQRLVIFLDNLSVHRSKAAMQEYQRLGVEVIFSIPYSPEYNGIECTFFTIK